MAIATDARYFIDDWDDDDNDNNDDDDDDDDHDKDDDDDYHDDDDDDYFLSMKAFMQEPVDKLTYNCSPFNLCMSQ